MSFGGSAAATSTPSFSFGGSSASTGSTATSTPSFSFGGSSASTGSTATPPLGGSSSSTFSFGGLSSGAPVATPASSSISGAGISSATTAAVSTPGFSFGAASSAGTSASSSAVASFSFGTSSSSSVPPPASAPSLSSGGSSAAASSGGGFSFASSSAGASGSSGGISFGISSGSSTSATSGASIGASSQAQAGSTTGTFSFQTSTPKSPAQQDTKPTSSPGQVASFAASGSAAAVKESKPKGELLSSIEGLPVDEIINEWTAELEKRSQAFRKHAEALSEWDRAILNNRHSLLHLEEELRRVIAGQESLEKRLQMLEAHQKGIHDTLSGMEEEAARLYRAERPLADENTAELDILYERTERAAAALVHVGQQLSDTITEVNQVTSAQLQAEDEPVKKLISVLNNQLNALTTLEAQTEEVAQKLTDIQQRSAP